MYTFLSKNYRNTSSAGNKAKTDIEAVMAACDFKNIGLKQTVSDNRLYGYTRTLSSVLKCVLSIKKGDILVLQYPFKKYFEFLCFMAHFKKARIITVIHDLGSFRRKRLTLEKEIRRLSCSDFIISHNLSMKRFLENNGCRIKMNELEIFDYLSKSSVNHSCKTELPYKVVYAGTLNYKKNKFIYEIANCVNSYNFILYGRGFDKSKFLFTDKVKYRGFIDSDTLISNNDGNFGLVWDGLSLETCTGDYGEYLKYNNPHKASFYLRCGMPIIVWSDSALSEFVKNNKLGFCINKISDIDEILKNLSLDEYQILKKNTEKFATLLNSGYFIKKAINEGIKYLNSKTDGQ